MLTANIIDRLEGYCRNKKLPYLERISIALRRKWYARLNIKYLFVFDQKINNLELPVGMTIERYERFEEIPQKAIEKIVNESGDRDNSINWLKREFKDNGVFFLAFINGESVVRQWIRYGKDFSQWLIDIEDHDFVFFAASTFKEWRGKGLSPLLKRYIIKQEEHTGAKAYGDVWPWNYSSCRALEKVGFRYVGKIKQREVIIASG